MLNLTETCCEVEDNGKYDVSLLQHHSQNSKNTNYILPQSNLPRPAGQTVLVSYRPGSPGPHDEMVGIPDYVDNYSKIAGARVGAVPDVS